MLTVTVEDPEVVTMSQDYCHHGKARKHFCGWRVWSLNLGDSCEHERECLIGSSGQPTSKHAFTWDLCMGLSAVYRKETIVLSNVSKGPS
jgi:hypothetical protein